MKLLQEQAVHTCDASFAGVGPTVQFMDTVHRSFVLMDVINCTQHIHQKNADCKQFESAGDERLIWLETSFLDYLADLKMCSLLSTGIAGIFGPSSDVTSMHVQSICDALDVPHIEMRWDFQLQRDDLSINLFPKPAVLAKAYVDLIKTWGWNRFALVYEDHEGIIRLQDFLKEARGNDWHIQMYQFHSGQPYRDLFWKIKKTKETRVVLDVKRENLFTALKHDVPQGSFLELRHVL
ncbi:glutamate receptor ionotropic, kainate 1-like [Dermacentor silvarum]|uniref:glutamate receptor ionotropic, kainate 1-like n=1 Tax=Dermacentor silvarum TaxID=543639 RepID=UPI0021019811|nr:glutamate receptor ionotropic, kainate 1-like [Dermacentor silvarum]